METRPHPDAASWPPGVAPEVGRILRYLRDRPGDKRPLRDLSVEDARARNRDLWIKDWNAVPPWVAEVRDARVATRHGSVGIRIYDPGAGSRPPIVFLHGGGFVLGDLETHDGIARRLALYAGRPVVSVDYRRAPDHPYPAPLEDCVAVVTALAAGGAGFALAGDSAGANLALGCALRLRDARGPRPSTLGLIFECYDPAVGSGSAQRFGGGEYGLGAADMRWFWRQYLGDLVASPPPDAAPLRADLAHLAPTLVGIGDCDLLFDENVALVDRLRAVGARCELRVWKGMTHGCVGWSRRLNQAEAQLAEVAVWLAGQTQPLTCDTLTTRSRRPAPPGR